MSAPDGFRLSQELRSTFLSYLTSALPIGNHRAQRQLGARFYQQWNAELFAGPYVEAMPSYRKTQSLDDFFGDVRDRKSDDYRFASGMSTGVTWADIDNKFPQYRRLRDALWPRDSEEAAEEQDLTTASRFWTRSLYEHQWQSFQRIIRMNRNLVIATATGSGKTECYLIPILYHLLSESVERRKAPGIRALLLYPMNALVEDQMHRLRQLLFWVNLQRTINHERPITFGRYTGATPVDKADRDPQRYVSPEALQGLGEIVFRSEMQAGPPDIIVTNFTMLEYILLRDDDQRMFLAPELFKFLVLDEVHTYSGTQGMEVSLLLRRLKSFLKMRSNGASSFLSIGTSATLPSGPAATLQTSDFASTLFGSPFSAEDVVQPLFERHVTTDVLDSAEQTSLARALCAFPNECPALSRVLGLSDGDPGEVPEDEWRKLIQLVNPNCELSDNADSGEQRYWRHLFEILDNSKVFDRLRSAFSETDTACLGLQELACSLFGTAPEAQQAVTTLLKLVGAAHKNGAFLLSLRFHEFVNEPAAAQVCLNPTCGSGEWWSRLYLSHHSQCETCNGFVYPILLCRRCGFAYLEGWRRRFPSGALGNDLTPEPDDADDEASYVRIVFRPLHSEIPEAAVADAEVHSLCLACGRWMVAETNPRYKDVIHQGCPETAVIQVCSWENQLHNGVLEECVFCEQHWIPGQDVATPPAPSVYATATVLVEELERGIERNGVRPFESKLLTFSDSRQQAAQLAYRFQKTNREFTFRQLVWKTIQDSGEELSTVDLIEKLYREVRSNHRLWRLLIDDETRLHDRTLLQRTITGLLFRESVAAYLTLEAQGIVRLSYDPRLFENVSSALQSDRLLLGRLSEEEQKSFLRFLLDWTLRFRYAIAPHPMNGSDLDWESLSRRNIVPKALVRCGADGARGELNFAVAVANRANRALNFCERLYRRIHGNSLRTSFTLSDLQSSLFAIWDCVLLPYVSASANRCDSSAIFNIGRSDPDGALLKINSDALRWNVIANDEVLYRCDACGKITDYSIRNVCPIRDCSGTLHPVTGREIDQTQFSPVRHYRRLISQQSLRPLRVEEHTAQVAATKRQAIEQQFRATNEDGIDVVCGSTTFELGIDLGTIHAVFMSNLPPRISNYRQRAGRAGRRAGMVPFILSYVRQRPHDQYFWSRLKEFIAGPITIPRLSVTSREVIARHANAIFTRDLMRSYQAGVKQPFPLDGPPAARFIAHVLSTGQISDLERRLCDKTSTLRREYDCAFSGIADADKPVYAADLYKERLVALQNTYLPLRAEDGAIAVCSDYGVLPSYAFPLYVDELRLSREPTDRAPRSELRLQRDRRIALQEYMPGKVIVAGKNLISSEGLWGGYEERAFRICVNRECQLLDFSQNAPLVCPECNHNRTSLTAVIPRGGFYGVRVQSIADQDMELARQRGETYFDPANEPPPNYQSYGNSLEIAIIGARVMEQSSHRPRMRQFNPRPQSDLVLELAPSMERDLALPHLPAARCLHRSSSNQARPIYLMHEFTTDIIRLRITEGETGTLITRGTAFCKVCEENPDQTRQRFYWDCLRRSLGEALTAAAGRILDIDSSEIGVTFHSGNGIVGGREFVFFDTAPGGAGYVRQIAERISEVFRRAEEITINCDCGDSCYKCLRTYHNQMFHSRLNRHFIAEGLHAFNARNWTRAVMAS